jgi:TonB family protein
MDEAAVAAVRRWRFHPARRFGLPVAVEVKKPLRFTIEPNR